MSQEPKFVPEISPAAKVGFLNTFRMFGFNINDEQERIISGRMQRTQNGYEASIGGAHAFTVLAVESVKDRLGMTAETVFTIRQRSEFAGSYSKETRLSLSYIPLDGKFHYTGGKVTERLEHGTKKYIPSFTSEFEFDHENAVSRVIVLPGSDLAVNTGRVINFISTAISEEDGIKSESNKFSLREYMGMLGDNFSLQVKRSTAQTSRLRSRSGVLRYLYEESSLPAPVVSKRKTAPLDQSAAAAGD